MTVEPEVFDTPDELGGRVARMIADGLSGPDIAAELQIGTATVKTHTQNVYDKLGVSERAAAVAAAMRRKMLE